MSDTLTLTLRLHDPLEKQELAKSATWAVIEIPREDLKMQKLDFLVKHVEPALVNLKQLELT